MYINNKEINFFILNNLLINTFKGIKMGLVLKIHSLSPAFGLLLSIPIGKGWNIGYIHFFSQQSIFQEFFN